MKHRFILRFVPVLVASFGAAAQEPAQRPARMDEVRAFCEAVRTAGETTVTGLDGATDTTACLASAMVVRKHPEGQEISGKWMWNYPGYSMRNTCRAMIRDGRVAPDAVDCRDKTGTAR